MKRISPALAAVLLAACGTDVSGPSSSLLSCVFGEPVAPPAGSVLQFRGADNQAVCLNGDGGAEFVYIPFHGARDSADDLTVRLTGAGFSDPGSVQPARIGLTPEPVVLGSAVERLPRHTPSYESHDRLRRREVEELEPRIRPGRSATPALAPVVAADVPAVGELRDFNVAISCDDIDTRTGRVMDVSQHAVIYADTANPAQLTPQDYAFFAATFDTLVYPVETAAFGEPTDIDENGRAILFFTRAVNQLNPQGSTSVTIGFFWSGDLFPATGTDRLQACPESNHGEMFYLIAPDPNGQVGVAFDLDDVRRLAIPLIGHEFQHLINASRRLFVNNAGTFEAGWLNEALSHTAEELLYFAVSGLSTGANLGIDEVLAVPGPADSIFNQYMAPNFNNFSKYLARPDTASLMGPANELGTRGAAWAFLRYAADRSGDPGFLRDVVNSQLAGLDNLNQVIGSATALDWMRDWTVSVYADDLVAGLEPRFTGATWNLRSVFEGSSLGQYPLRVRTLTSGQTVSDDLLSGAATFNRFGVATGDRAVIHVETDGGSPDGALRGSFLRVR